jgi:dihydrofolate synthase / folylpolyglutamate synthase
VLDMDRAGIVVAAPGDDEPLRVGLLGRHQAANAAVAIAVLDALAKAGIAHVTQPHVARAFTNARWPGRLELVALDGGGPDVLLDGAHNPHGTAALAAALDELRPQLSPGRPTLLIGVVREKDLVGMLAPLRASAALGEAAVIATTVPDTPRSLDPYVVADAWGTAARVVADPTEALAVASDLARAAGGPLVICGSLYLVGHLRPILVGRN